MRPVLLSNIAAFGLLGSVLAAQAADIGEPMPIEAAPIVEPSYDWYIAARIGAAFNRDTDFGVLGTSVSNSYDTGWVGSLAVGTQFNLGGLTPRGEIEVGYSQSDVDSHDVAGVGTFDGSAASGKTSVLYGLVNGYIDFLDGPIKPYVGAGIGVGHVKFDNHGVTGVGTVLDDSGTGFAWQVGGGVSYAFTPQMTADLGYRYFNVENVELTAIDGTDSDVDVRSHQVTIGLRYSF